MVEGCGIARADPEHFEKMGTTFCGVVGKVRAGGHDFQFTGVKMVVPKNSAKIVPVYGQKRQNRGV